MSKRLVFVCVAVAAALFLASGQTTMAQVDVFGYPAGGGSCGGAACGSPSIAAQQRSFGYGQFKDRVHATQAQNEKIYARNAAWPKPFTCASRQLYHNMFRPMYDAGWEDQCILTSTHFDENGDLTRYGRQQISGMLMNMPKARRIIFVQTTSDATETQARLAKVQTVIQTLHPQRSGIVRASDRTPATLPGWRAVDIIEKATANAPSPVIPIANGSSGISQAVTQ